MLICELHRGLFPPVIYVRPLTVAVQPIMLGQQRSCEYHSGVLVYGANPKGSSLTSQSLEKREAWKRYLLIRQKAYKICMDEFHDVFGERLMLDALSESNVRDEVAGWGSGLDWHGLLSKTNNIKRPRNFDLGIFYVSESGKSAKLVGAAQGRVSKGHKALSHVRIDFLARKPTDNPFQGYITDIAVHCAAHYASLIDKKRVLLTNPSKNVLAFQHFMDVFEGKYRERDKNFPYDYFYLNLEG